MYIYLHQAEDNLVVSLCESTTLLLSAKIKTFQLSSSINLKENMLRSLILNFITWQVLYSTKLFVVYTIEQIGNLNFMLVLNILTLNLQSYKFNIKERNTFSFKSIEEHCPFL